MTLAAALHRILTGDVTAMPEIETATHDEVLATAIDVRCTLTAQAVCRAIHISMAGGCSDVQLQQWASFVRRGSVGRPGGYPVRPVDIEYEVDQEATIADVVSRMDDLGDMVDGEASSSERLGWVESLTCSPDGDQPR